MSSILLGGAMDSMDSVDGMDQWSEGPDWMELAGWIGM